MLLHLAAAKIPRYGDALDTLVTNSQGGLQVLKAAHEHGVRRFVLASTSDCYGRNPAVPFSEESVSVIGSPLVRRWSYAVSKMLEEQALFAYKERHGLEAVALRLFGGYGPRQHLSWWGGPQAVFISAALKGEPLELHGTGGQTRSFTYVDDIVEGFVAAADVPAADGELFNIGSDREISIEGLARLIWGLVRDDEPRLRLVPLRLLRALRRRGAARARQPQGGAGARTLARGPPRGRHDAHGGLAARPPEEGGPALIHVVIPVYNEAANVEAMLRATADQLAPIAMPYRILMVDDGSTDRTVEMCQASAKTWPVDVVSHARNLGPGAAFRTGFLRVLEGAGASDVVVTMEGDQTSDPRILKRMLRRVWEEDDHIALASCYLYGGGIRGTSLYRVAISHVANGLMKKTLGLSGLATLSSFYRVYQVAALQALHARYGERFISTRGFECMVEILYRAAQLGLRISEVPMVLDGGRRAGRSKMRVVQTSIAYLALALRALRGRL